MCEALKCFGLVREGMQGREGEGGSGGVRYVFLRVKKLEFIEIQQHLQ